MKITIKLLPAAWICVLTSANAANRYFDGDASTPLTWDQGTTANWSTSAAGGPYNTLWAGYDNGFFKGTGANVTVSGTVQTNGLTFSSNGYNLSGGTIHTGSPTGGTLLSVESGISTTISSNITQTSLGMSKTGSGTLNLSGSSINITGGTGESLRVLGGTLNITGQVTSTSRSIRADGANVLLKVSGSGRIWHNVYSGNGTGVQLRVQNGATVELDTWGYGLTSESLGGLRAGTDAIAVNNGTIRIVGTTATTYGRGVTVSAGGATLESGAGANWHLDNVSNTAGWSFASTAPLNLAGAGTGRFDKVYTGSGTLAKSGAGTWTLGGVNLHTGITRVDGGTLALASTGSIAQSSQIIVGANTTVDVTAVPSWTVGSTQTLSGSGRVLGNALINGDIRPGTSPGALTVTGNLDLALGSDCFIEIGGTDPTDFDRLLVSGNLSAGGTIWVSFVDGFDAAASNTFDIADFSTFTDDGYTFDFTNATLGSGLTWNTTSFASNGIIAVVPEPSAILLIGLGMTSLMSRRGRH